MRQADVVALGYLAVEQRLRVRTLPRPPVEGVVGRAEAASLTNDSPVVALALAQSGFVIDAALSHPGNLPEGRAALDLITTRLRSARFGPDLGSPLELQVTDHYGERLWFCDPQAGLASLHALDTSQLDGAWAYVDGFDWIDRHWLLDHLPISDRLFVNLGKRRPAEAEEEVAFWTSRQGRAVTLQVSFESADAPHVATWLSDLVARQPSTTMIATLGAAGLVLGLEGSVQHIPPVSVPGAVLDQSGAGAAVSAEFLRWALRQGPSTPEEIGRRLVIAGATQCAVQGCLDADSQREWLRALSSGQDTALAPKD